MKFKIIALFFVLFFGFHVSISAQEEQLILEGAITIENSNSETPSPGTIRWTGSDFEGFNGVTWISLTGFSQVGSVIDIDGNEYQTIRIGDQEWMAQNLKTSKYRAGTIIDQVTNDATWNGLSTAAWCWYDNHPSNDNPYGKL